MAKSKPTTKRQADPIVARSRRELAELVGRSHTSIGRWLEHDGWTFGGGPWKASTVIAIKEWARRELPEGPETDAAGSDSREAGKLSIRTKADVQLKMTRNKKLVWEMERDQGRYHLIDECKARKLRQFADLRQGFLAVSEGLPVDADVRAMVRGRHVELLRRIALGLGIADMVGSSATTPSTPEAPCSK